MGSVTADLRNGGSGLDERGRNDERLDVRAPGLDQHLEFARPVPLHSLSDVANLLEPHHPLSPQTDAGDCPSERLEVVDVRVDGATRGEVEEVHDEVR